MISTVRGEISENELGICSSHEHIFIDMRNCVDISGNEPEFFYNKISMENRGEVLQNPYAILDNALLDGIEDAIAELKEFKKYGGNTIIDATPDEIGRNPLALREVSEKSGVNIILGCGHYYKKAHCDYVKEARAKELAMEMIDDITKGIGNTGIKAGIIGEIGTSASIHPDEKKVLIAAGIAGAETGKAIHIHTDLYTENGYEIIDILTREGVAPEKICIDHVDVLLRPDYIKSLLERGVYVEFDNFGKEFYVSKKERFAYDLERVILLKELIDEGYSDRLLICNDICLKTMWKKYGGPGYAHILRTIKSMASDYGIDEGIFNKMLSENVKNFIK